MPPYEDHLEYRDTNLVNPIIRRLRDSEMKDPEGFWSKEAEALHWFKRWDSVFEWEPPKFKWFSGGLTNVCYNCLDRHVQNGRGGQAAIIAENESGEMKVLTFHQLFSKVKTIASALRGLDVKRGERVAIYMPTIPEAIATMLACARIGAIHIVVFAGFGSHALAERMRLSGAKILVTVDRTRRRGREINLWNIARVALREPGLAIQNVVVIQRGGNPPQLELGRDIDWLEFLKNGTSYSSTIEMMQSTDPLFILATSGTTASAKLAVHVHGGYEVWINSQGRWVFGEKPSDIWWSTSDIGWIVGHSYIVYAPLICGSTTIVYEGVLDAPDPRTFYRIIDDNGVNGIFTSPTAIRLLMRYGLEPAKGYNLETVERVFSAGEVLNPPAWNWIQNELFKNKIPVIDHMWQTETGGPIFANPYGVSLIPIKPGSAGIPLPGISFEILREDGTKCSTGEKGVVVITRPFPGLISTLWGDEDRYKRDYWDRIQGGYFTGDGGFVDEDGYVWFTGRADEIIKISDHRIGTIEVESAFLLNPAVAEAGVTARSDELRGSIISAFISLKTGYEPSEQLRKELVETVKRELGAIAVIGEINFVTTLPKTRSGKIMRRVLKSIVLEIDPGDISTIEDDESVEEARNARREMLSQLKRKPY